MSGAMQHVYLLIAGSALNNNNKQREDEKCNKQFLFNL